MLNETIMDPQPGRTQFLLCLWLVSMALCCSLLILCRMPTATVRTPLLAHTEISNSIFGLKNINKPCILHFRGVTRFLHLGCPRSLGGITKGKTVKKHKHLSHRQKCSCRTINCGSIVIDRLSQISKHQHWEEWMWPGQLKWMRVTQFLVKGFN